MWNKKLILFLFLSFSSFGQDWLIDQSIRKAEITVSNETLILSNGLIQKSFFLSPNLVAFDFLNKMTGEQILRTILPEAKIQLNNQEYFIGGELDYGEKAYFKDNWKSHIKVGENNFQFKTYSIEEIKPNFPFKITNYTSTNQYGSGKKLNLLFSHPDFPKLDLFIIYEIFDNIPLISKSVELRNHSKETIQINQVSNEYLAVVEEESAVVGATDKMKTNHQLYIESNFAFNNSMHPEISNQSTHWQIDSSYTSQVNYQLMTPAILEVFPDKGYGIELKPNQGFQSIKTYELILDSYDRERNGLARRKMYRTIAPWTQQNPIFMHLVSKDDQEVIKAINQCDSTGYEALILSFGSHINMEDTSSKNLIRWKKLADYAHEKGIKIGGYSLFSSRSIGPETDVIDPTTLKPGGAFFGNAPCLASEWGLNYLNTLKNFYLFTGFDLFENDGPYPGDVCASTHHPGHKGLEDSQWIQINLQKELYRWMNERGIYINAPDWYFLDGTHKIAMGYREVNFSLPRDQQRILNRQNIYDATWEKTPSMGWGFVPLTVYHGGGEDAILEPLSKHLSDYQQLMMQYYGAGIQACYRGPRLYDTKETKEMVIKTIQWYKKYRDILNSDIIRLKRADGRSWDGWMHLNPNLKEKGLVMVFNPTGEDMNVDINLPLYYSGLSNNAKIRIQENKAKEYQLDRNYQININLTIPANSYNWLVIE